MLLRQQELLQQIAVTGIPDSEEQKRVNLRAERRMTSILVIEVTNIGTAIELLHPATLSTLLQEYQFYLRQAVRLYRGIVNRIEGDRALVTFDVRHCQEDHATNAICCGQLFTLLMQKVAAGHKANHAQSLDFNVVVHSGDAYFSPVWKQKKPGKEKKREETVIGKAVDLACELLGHCTNGYLLVSELSYDMAGGPRRFSRSKSGEISNDTDTPALMTYMLAPDDGSHADMLERQ